MSPRYLQKPSQGATRAKRNDFEHCYFVLFFAINLEHLASQDGPKTAKEPPNPELSEAPMMAPEWLPGGSQGPRGPPRWLPTAPRDLPGAPRWPQGPRRSSWVAPKGLQAFRGPPESCPGGPEQLEKYGFTMGKLHFFIYCVLALLEHMVAL